MATLAAMTFGMAGAAGGAAEPLAGQLLRASLQGALAVALVWAVCRLFPRLPAALRCGLWWLACAKLLLALVWTAAVPLPVLPARAGLLQQALRVEWSIPAPSSDRIPSYLNSKSPFQVRKGLVEAEIDRHPPVAVAARPGAGRLVEAAGASSLLPWAPLLVGLWAAGVLAHLAATAVHLRRVRGVLRRAAPAPPEVVALAADLGVRLGLRRPVEVLVSPETDTPQVIGVLRPRVLLPELALGRLAADELAMTLCHELLHVRRGDLWLGWAPALAQRLFFFHPLARLAAREYALAREAACDAAVLAAMRPAPEAYGRLLLRLGVAPRPPRWAAAGAAPTFRTLKRRLDMLQHSARSNRPSRAWWALAVLAALAALVPFRMVAQEEEPEAVAPVAVAVEVAPVGAVVDVAPVADVAPVPASAPVVNLAPVVAVASIATVPPVAAVAAVPASVASAKAGAATSYSYAYGDDEAGDGFVLLRGDGTSTMNGTGRDHERARRALGGENRGIWFERGGKEYVIRDEATLAEAAALFGPQRELGRLQGELGAKQGELGALQGEIARRQAEIAGQQAELAGRQGELSARQAELIARQAAVVAERHRRRAEETEEERAQSAELRRQMDVLHEEMAKLGREMGELGGGPMAELGRKQGELGQAQGELGRRQGELGRRQAELARQIQQQLRGLLDRAIASGVAKEVN